MEIINTSTVVFMIARNLWSFNEEGKGEFEKTEDAEKRDRKIDPRKIDPRKITPPPLAIQQVPPWVRLGFGVGLEWGAIFRGAIFQGATFHVPLKYGVDVSEKSKVIYGRSSTKWTLHEKVMIC